MKFPKTETNSNFESEFKKPVFMYIQPGQYRLRILGPRILVEKTHFIKGPNVTVVCQDDRCPICKNNDRLMRENPGERFNDVPGVIPWRWTFYTNVYDKTPVKKCPECGRETNAVNGRFSNTCWNCETMLSNVTPEPSNTIKILTRGKQLKERLELINNTELDESGQPIGIENYDIKFLVGRDKQPIPSADLSNSNPIDYDPDDLFPLETVPIRLEPREILDLQRGVSLRDIFLARNEDSEPQEAEFDLDEGVEEEIEQNVKGLFD
jgi:hypothetical protein